MLIATQREHIEYLMLELSNNCQSSLTASTFAYHRFMVAHFSLITYCHCNTTAYLYTELHNQWRHHCEQTSPWFSEILVGFRRAGTDQIAELLQPHGLVTMIILALFTLLNFFRPLML